ncbi:MAG: VOC family protein [Pseudomonadota bacterium]|nr:VOC family protein [Pseudomonadota bacterium]
MSKIDFVDAKAGVHSIDHFALAVPDLQEQARFLEALGLRVERQSERLLLRTGDSDHIWAIILPGERKKLAYVAMACYDSDLEQIRTQVEQAGGSFEAAHPAGDAQGFWFRDPDGILFQVKAGAKTQPDAKSRMPELSIASNVRGAPARSAARTVHPTRLSHMALFSSNVTQSLAFHTQALGVKLADRSGEIIAFTYGRHGSDHHLLAFLASGGPGLHHASWDVPSVEDCGLGNTQLRAAGYARHWGPGRHVLGSNYFNYAKDSFGQWWELSAHIDYIEKDADWVVANFSDEDSLYLWGPDLPEEFPVNVEL